MLLTIKNTPRRFALHRLLCTLVLFAILAVPAAAWAERRVALVIGNSNYDRAPLANPRNDAVDMARLLEEELGFETTLHLDLDQGGLIRAVQDFGQQIVDADVRLFYYAGHGVGVSGKNYLIPVAANIETEDDVEIDAVDANRILQKMESAGPGANVIVLDACRDNPLKRNTRSHRQGLERIKVPAGSLIIYATAPGEVALDGRGRNGTFTKHLLNSLRAPDVHLNDVALDVRVAVMGETDNRQVPWSESSLTRRIYLAGRRTDEQPNVELAQTDSNYENEILSAYLAAANAGDAVAQARLGYIHDIGRSVTEDNETALFWYRKAIANGNTDAKVNLGAMYQRGDGVAQDQRRAFELFLEAATSNNIIAQYNVGVMYQYGQGTRADFTQAMRWYRAAVDQGHAEAAVSLGDLYSYGLGVEEDPVVAVEWYRFAAERGSAAGQSELGYFYETGIGLPEKNNELARHWFGKAAQQGYPRALYNLGEIYELGRGVPVDLERARGYYDLAARQGDEEGQKALQRLSE